MTDAILGALLNLTNPRLLAFMMLGIIVGLIIGILPGLGGVVGASLFVPFLFGMDPFVGMAMLVGFAAVGQTSDTFPSVLLGVPGSAGSQATVLDGYALAKKGEGARALGASFSASMLGGVFGAIALLLVVTVARPLIHALTSPELFMLTVLGLTTVGVLVRGDPLLGLAAAMIGLMLGTIGGAPATPEYRYIFGTLYLYDGLPLVAVAMGLFALPEVMHLLVRGLPIAGAQEIKGGLLQGLRETFRHKFLVLRSSLVGVTVGVIPGMGGSVVDWMAYGIAQQTVKDNSNFGNGDIRGVIAPESANNAKEGGTLIPTLVLGIPGSGTSAILLGGMILMGLTPGPRMLTVHLDVTLTVVWTLVIANLIAGFLCILLSKWIAKITFIPPQKLAPFLLIVFVAAAFQATRHYGDLIAMFIIGIAAYFMKLVGMPRAPVLIGFVLAANFERYLHLSMSRYGAEWMRETSVLILAALILLVTVGGPVYRYYQRSDVTERLSA